VDDLGLTAVRHSEPSLLLSLDDEPWQPSGRLLGLAADLARAAPAVSHRLLAGRSGGGPRWYEQFPGEHYHLLTALAQLLRPALVWEFGTDTGMSTLALLEGVDPGARVFTVDIDPWQSKSGAWLAAEDFAAGRVTQVVADMASPTLFAGYGPIIAEADLIFVDGPKDGRTEDRFLERLAAIAFHGHPIVVFDDIRLMNMVHVWRGIARPKMDLTSFGHWSGTGLVDWCPQPTMSA
jgi:predicted O-methyltransferase YrrM